MVDTCALAHEDCLKVIENAKRVTFILSTLEEMDKKDKQILRMEIIHNGDTITYHKNDMTPVVPGDLIYFYNKCKGVTTKKTFRI